MMTWTELHNNELLYGKRIGSVKNLGGEFGLPNQKVLSQLLDRAQGLSIQTVNAGMSFTWCRALVENGKVSFHNKTEIVDTFKKPANICYEDRVFPVDPGDGHLLIRQSLAPCVRCRAAFRAWAMQRGSTIIVAADEGYDKSADNTVFIYSPTRAAFQW